MVSHEKKGLDFVLEVHFSGDRKKDFETNVRRYARLGLPEYFAFDRRRMQLSGWRLPDPNARAYVPIVPQAGRFASAVLNLDLALEDQRVRFYFGTAPLAEAEELVQRLEHMVDEVTARAQLETEKAQLETEEAGSARQTSKPSSPQRSRRSRSFERADPNCFVTSGSSFRRPEDLAGVGNDLPGGWLWGPRLA